MLTVVDEDDQPLDPMDRARFIAKNCCIERCISCLLIVAAKYSYRNVLTGKTGFPGDGIQALRVTLTPVNRIGIAR